MIVIIYTDGDSGIYNPKTQEYYKEFLDGSSEFALVLEDSMEIRDFSIRWYNNKYKITDKVYEVLNYVIPDVLDALYNKTSGKFFNGNYHISVYKECNFY